LLPGAVLITLKPGDQSLAAGQSMLRPDGTAQVSVRAAQAMSGSSTTSGKAFTAELLSGEQVRTRAEYLISKTGDVFDDGRSTADAGRLSLQVGRSLALDRSTSLRRRSPCSARAQVRATARSAYRSPSSMRSMRKASCSVARAAAATRTAATRWSMYDSSTRPGS
jgi:hypothetical protein